MSRTPSPFPGGETGPPIPGLIGSGPAMKEVYRLTRQTIAAVIDGIETADDVEQCRFAGSRWAHDGDELTGGHIEVDVTQYRQNQLTDTIAFVYLCQVDHRPVFPVLILTMLPAAGALP